MHLSFEAARNRSGRNYRCWRANRSFNRCIAAKDPSKYLVAGCCRNLRQESGYWVML